MGTTNSSSSSSRHEQARGAPPAGRPFHASLFGCLSSYKQPIFLCSLLLIVQFTLLYVETSRLFMTATPLSLLCRGGAKRTVYCCRHCRWKGRLIMSYFPKPETTGYIYILFPTPRAQCSRELAPVGRAHGPFSATAGSWVNILLKVSTNQRGLFHAENIVVVPKRKQ